MKKISRLQFITTNAKTAEEALKGGVDWVQLRLKDAGFDEFYIVAKEVQSVCKKYNATFIINDNVELAKLLGADGVHLGKEDMPPSQAREILGDGFIIGCSANSRKTVMELASLPIDYIGLGPYRFTHTKKKLGTILGVSGYKRIIEYMKENSVITQPIIAIGGIDEYDIEELMEVGVYGIAVSGAICNAYSIAATAAKFKKIVTNNTKQSI